MKKSLALVSALLILFASCGSKPTPEVAPTPDTKPVTTLKVGASPTPHGEILKEAAKILAERDIKLEVIEFSDYVQPNLALANGDLDANYFQHGPYLDFFNADRGLNLAATAHVHYEPLGVYAGKTASLAELADGAQIALPNDESNEARALLLLEAQGVITLKEGAGVSANLLDIVSNPKNIKFVELAAEQVANSLQDVDVAVINGNYALLAGIDVNTALAKEESDSLAAQTYSNILVINADKEETPALKELAKVLTSPEIKTYITNSYAGAVVPTP